MAQGYFTFYIFCLSFLMLIDNNVSHFSTGKRTVNLLALGRPTTKDDLKVVS